MADFPFVFLTPILGSVAQLYRALDFGSSGWGLESLRGHKQDSLIEVSLLFLITFTLSISR